MTARGEEADWKGASVPASAVILAGGGSERLGRDKATVELAGKTLLEREVGLMRRLSDDVIVVLRPGQPPQAWGARVVTDAEPYTGVMAAIAAGLAAARYDWSLVVACDMPFVSPYLVRHMMSLRRGYDAIVPRLEVGLEPLHALYHQRCLPALLSALARGEHRVVSFYGSLKIRFIAPSEIRPYDPEERSFFNINTPQELAQAEEWLRET